MSNFCPWLSKVFTYLKSSFIGWDIAQPQIEKGTMKWRMNSTLTHWGRVTHICVSDRTSIGSDNGLSPGRRQAIIRTNAGILFIRPLGTNFSEFLVEILIFSFKKMRLKVSSAKRRPFCLGLNELMPQMADVLLLSMLISSHQSTADVTFLTSYPITPTSSKCNPIMWSSNWY